MNYHQQQLTKETTKVIKMLNHLIKLIIILAIIYSILLFANKCEAQHKTALALAQCIIAECNHCDNDMKEPIATAFVLYKRMIQYNDNKYNKRKRSFYEQIRIYCAVFNKGAAENYNGHKQIERRNNILASTFSHPVYLDNKVTKEYWYWLELFCYAFVYNINSYTDPCPNAMHFGGSMDISNMYKRGWVIDKECSGLKNHFFIKK